MIDLIDVALVANDRPDYFREVLESWKNDWPNNAKFVTPGVGYSASERAWCSDDDVVTIGNLKSWENIENMITSEE